MNIQSFCPLAALAALNLNLNPSDKQTKRQRPKSEFNIVSCTLAMSSLYAGRSIICSQVNEEFELIFAVGEMIPETTFQQFSDY